MTAGVSEEAVTVGDITTGATATESEEISARVVAAYRRKYPDIVKVEVEHIARELLPGFMVVVQCEDQKHSIWDEVCYVDKRGVQIFDTTEQLIRALLAEARSIETVQDLTDRRKRMTRLFARLQVVQFGFLGCAVLCVLLAVVAALRGASSTLSISLAAYGFVLFVPTLFARTRLRRLETDLEEIDYKIDLQRFQVSLSESRAEKVLRLNDFQLRRYYDSTLRHNSLAFWLGVICIALGVGISAWALWFVAGPSAAERGPDGLGEKIVTAVLGAVAALLTNYVAVIYLKIHAAAAGNMVTLHARLVDTHRALLGNLVASRITDEKLRWNTFAEIARSVSQSTDPPSNTSH